VAARARILEELRDSDAGLDTNALAGIVELHPNTVRWHLKVLTRQGLVRSASVAGHRRGRPSLVYRLTAAGFVEGRDEYQLLAAMLTTIVAESADSKTGPYEAGMRWGRYLHHKPSPTEPTDDQTTVKRVIELLDEHGFDAEPDGTTVCMHRCPFNDLAQTNPEIICTLHHGIIDGALEEAGSRLRVSAIHPFAKPTLCTATLEPAA
jgi:predicted ArsR family transcriptional regulator